MSAIDALAPELLEQFVELLAEQLAPKLADELAARLEAPNAQRGNGLGLSGLVTLDELVAELPPAKKPETWKRWLYERLRQGEKDPVRKVPGASKLAGSWFFDVERVRAWLADGAP